MMQPSIESLIKDGNRTVKGLIHVGSNDGEELPHYVDVLGINHILLFEPLKNPYNQSLKRINQLSSSVHVNACHIGLLDQQRRITMKVTENDKASSILSTIDVDDWTTHIVFKDWNMGQWPVVGYEKCKFDRYDKIAKRLLSRGILDPEIYNTVVMDVQGVEDRALKGFGAMLEFIDYILIELSETPVYKGQKSGHEIELWLDKQGFDMITPMKLHDNVLFIRRGK